MISAVNGRDNSYVNEKATTSAGSGEETDDVSFQSLLSLAGEEEKRDSLEKQPGILEMLQAAVLTAGSLLTPMDLRSVNLAPDNQSVLSRELVSSSPNLAALFGSASLTVAEGAGQNSQELLNFSIPTQTLTKDQAATADPLLSIPPQVFPKSSTAAVETVNDTGQTGITSSLVKSAVGEESVPIKAEIKSDHLPGEEVGKEKQPVNKREFGETTRPVASKTGQNLKFSSDPGANTGQPLMGGKETKTQNLESREQGPQEVILHTVESSFVQKADLVPETGTTDIVHQVADQVADAVKNQRFQLNMKLQPEGLGQLTVKMVYEGGKLSLHIVADSQQVQNLLVNQMGDLKSALAGQQIDVHRMNVVLQDGNKSFLFDGGFRNFSENGRDSQKNNLFHLSGQGISEEENETKDALHWPVLSSGVLNYRI